MKAIVIKGRFGMKAFRFKVDAKRISDLQSFERQRFLQLQQEAEAELNPLERLKILVRLVSLAYSGRPTVKTEFQAGAHEIGKAQGAN
jgi:hypothetical protein